MSDEQPGSWMFYEADLHTDRLSANEQRAVAWNYRQLEFAPAEVIPGFAFHQTDRDPTVQQRAACPDARCSNYSRARDLDLLRARYSVLSSVGTGGLNNVMNMLPARDPQEFDHFPKEDIEFVRLWLQWADDNVELLRNTRVLPGFPQPSAGRVDGVAMVNANAGALFLFNPTAVPVAVTVGLNSSIGFDCALGLPIVAELIGSSDRGALPHKLAIVNCGGALGVTVPATTAVVIGLEQWGCVSGAPQLFGIEAAAVDIDLNTAVLAVTRAQGEAGTAASGFVALPPGTPKLSAVTVNGVSVPFAQSSFRHVPTVNFTGRWANGPTFSNEIGSIKGFQGGAWSASFTVPAGAMLQLKARNATYPIEYDTDPSGNNDANVPWLAPGRLLVFAKYRPLLNDSFNATAVIDGQPVIVRKAYNTIVRSPARFIGCAANPVNPSSHNVRFNGRI